MPPPTVIPVEEFPKVYRLGQTGRRTLSEDLNRWWARFRGKPDPYLKIGQEDRSNRDGERIWALRDVSFTVQQGNILDIIGRDGAGKRRSLGGPTNDTSLGPRCRASLWPRPFSELQRGTSARGPRVIMGRRGERT